MPDLFEQIDAAEQARQDTDLFKQIDAAEAERENDPLFKAIDQAAAEKRTEDLKRIPGAQTVANLIGAGSRAVKRVQQFGTVAKVLPEMETISRTGGELDVIEAEKGLPDEELRPGSTEHSARMARREVEDIIASVRERVPANQRVLLDQYAPTPEQLDALEESQRQKVRNVIEAERAPAIARTIPQLIKMAQQETEIQRIPISEARKVFNESEGVKELMLAVVQNPSVNLELMLEGAITGSPAILGGVVGGVLAGPQGGAAGAALGAFGVEYVAALSDELARREVDTTDPEAIKAEILKPGFFDAVQQRGVDRGIPIAVASAIGGMIGGRTIARAATTGRSATLAALQEGGEQVVLQAGGEAAAQVSAGDKIDPREIYAEAVGGAGESIRAIVQGGLQRTQAAKQATAGIVEKATTPVDTLREVGEVQEDLADQARRSREERVAADVKVARAQEQGAAAIQNIKTAGELARLEAIADGVIEQTNANLQPVEVPPAIVQAEVTDATTITRGAPERGQEEGVVQGADQGVRLWDAGPAQETPVLERADEAQARVAVEYPVAPETVDGRVVREDIPNTGSIESSLTDYEVLSGVREVPLSDFTGLTGRHYSVQGSNRIAELASQIEASGEINPLIVVVDANPEGPYILEGATRAEALKRLNANSLPAMVVVDKGSFEDAFDNNEPVSARVVDAYGIELPEGYTRQGNVYQPTPEAPTLPQEGRTAPGAGQEPSGAREAATGQMVDLSDEALIEAEAQAQAGGQPTTTDLSDQVLQAAEAEAQAQTTQPGLIRNTALEQWADRQIAENQNRLTGGLDPLQAFAYAVKGAALIEQGVTNLAAWSAEMGRRFANLTAEQIRSLWDQANQIAADVRKGRPVEVPQRAQAAATPPTDTVVGPPPQTPDGEPTVPTPPEGMGVRRLAERVITDEAQPREVRQELADSPEIFYEKFSNNALMEAARDASDAELVQMRNSGDERVGAHALIEQANRASEAGNAQEAADLYAAASRVFTGPAQLLNVAKSVRNPLGMVTMLDRQIQKTGRKLTQKQKDELLILSKRRIDAEREMNKTAKAAEADFSEANEKAYVNARDKVGDANRQLQAFLHDVTPLSWADLIVMTMQGNLLTPLSIAANVFGNLAWYPVRRGGKGIASALDFAYSTLTGTPRSVKGAIPLTSRYEIRAAWEGIKVASRELITGPSNESYVRQETQRGFRPLRAWVQAWSGENLPRDTNGRILLSDRLKKMFEGTVGIPAEVMFRFLSLGDKPFRRAAEAETLVEGARMQNLRGRERERAIAFPDEPTQARLETESRAAIFVQENAVTKILAHMDREFSRIPTLGPAIKVFGRMMFPYRQFPVNFVLTALDFALPEWGMGRAVFRSMKGDRRGAAISLGNAAMGAMMYGGAALLWKAGLVSEPPDKDDKKKRSVQYEQMGPNRINMSGLARYMQGGDSTYRLGDTVVDYSKMGIPAAIFHIYTLGQARDKAIRVRRGQPEEPRNFLAKYGEDRFSAFPGMGSFVMDQSFLAGANSFLEAIQDTSPSGTKFNSWMQNIFRAVSSIPVPNTVEAVARTQYEYIPELRGDTLGETLGNVWKFKLQMLPKDDRAVMKRGLFGEPIPRTPAGANPFIYHLIDVTKKEAKAPDAFKQSLLELYQATELPDVYPTPPERTVQRGGISVRLTPQDYNDLQAVVGQFRRQVAEPVVSRPDFLNLSPVERVTVLKQVYERAGTRARAWFVARPEIQQRYFQSPDRVISITPRARVRQQALEPAR